MTPEQKIRAKALKIARQTSPELGLQDLVEEAELLAGWIATGELDKPWSGSPATD